MDGSAEDYMSRLARVWDFAVTDRCPFCTAMVSPKLTGGEDILVLSGIFTGVHCKVVQPPYPEWLRPGEILLEPLKGDRGHFRFDQKAELAQRIPGLDRPDWFPPVSLIDAADLHETILRFCLRHNWDSSKRVDWVQFYVLVEHVWRRRLPLEGAEVGILLQKHGLPNSRLSKIVDLFEHCRAVLVVAAGRKPIKKKRTNPCAKKVGWMGAQ
jgi:hypothetical protein